MKQNTELHKKFLKFSLGILRSYRFQAGILFLTLVSHHILSYFILPFQTRYLINDIIINRNMTVLPRIIIRFVTYLLAETILYAGGHFSERHLGDLSKNFKRNLIKFLISDGKNLNGEEGRIEAITGNATGVFFRSLMQLIPSFILFIIILFYFAFDSLLYFLPIGAYVAYNVIRKIKTHDNAVLKNKKQYLQQNNTADSYIEKNKFMGNEENFVDSLDDFLQEDGVAVVLEGVNNETKFTNLTKTNANKKSFRTIFMSFVNNILRGNFGEICFAFANGVVFWATDINNVTLAKILLLLFFTLQIVFLLKIIINTHHLNVKNINDIKKQLNCIGSI
jgi:hypothetical protein